MKLIPNLRFPEFEIHTAWKEQMLGDEDISTIVRGGSPRPITEYLTNSKDGLNWLKIGDVDKASKYVLETEDKVLPSAFTKTREVFPGDLIMSNSMSFGRPYILKIQTCIHDGWIAVTEISEEIDTDFLYYLILSDGSQRYFTDSAAGGGIKNLNAEIIKKLPVTIPSKIEEQQKIASCLSSLDELIAAHNDKLDALKDHKKGLLQNLFPNSISNYESSITNKEDDQFVIRNSQIPNSNVPKVRFPEFEGDGEWDVKTFEELFSIGSGKDYKHLEEGEIPVYGSGGYMLSVNDYLYDGESVCIGRKGTIDNPIFLTGKFWTVDTLFYTHDFNECIPKFIFYDHP